MSDSTGSISSRVCARWLQHPGAVACLEAVTLTYVGLPLVIYFVGWLRWYIALPLVLAYVGALAWSGMRAVQWAAKERGPLADDAFPDDRDFVWKGAIILVLVPFAVAATGIGAFTFQFVDYAMYDANLRLLIDLQWPVGMITNFPVPESELPAVYYWTYWLVPALVGKAFGWTIAYFSWFLWNLLGVFIAITWFLRIVGTLKLRFVLLFLFFGGLDILGHLYTAPWPSESPTPALDYFTATYWWSTGRGWIDHWTANFALLTDEGQTVMGGVFYRFFSNLSFLFDGPMHVLPGWVIVMTILHDVWRRKTLERAFLISSGLPMASIFVTMGTVPILALSMWHTRLRGLFTVGNCIVGPVIVLIAILYYRTIHAPFPNDWLWAFQDLNQTWLYLIIHYTVEFGIYALIVPAIWANGYRPGRPWFYGAIIVFLCAPWYRFGLYNDFTTKVIIPAQVVFLLCLATALRNPEGLYAKPRQYALVGLLVLGSWASVGILLRSIEFGYAIAPPPKSQVRYSHEVLPTEPNEGVETYPDAFYWRYLAKPVEYFRAPEIQASYTMDFVDEPVDLEEWYFYSDDHAVTPQGLQIRTRGNQPLIRRDAVRLDTNRVGTLQLDYTIEAVDGDVPSYMLVFQWAHLDDRLTHGEHWPFHRWRSNVLSPHRDSVKTNSYWRGTVQDIVIYFSVFGGADDAEYVITLKRLDFLER